MLKTLMFAVVLIGFPTAAFADTAVVVTTENGFNRPGGDVSNQPMPNADYCRALCITNRCAAYTFVREGTQGTCWLKSWTPEPVPDPNMVSGIRVTLLNASDNRNYPGGDYRHFDYWNPRACQTACNTEYAAPFEGVDRCTAWTWVKPGIQNELGRCYLKFRVSGPPVEDPCCVSGRAVVPD